MKLDKKDLTKGNNFVTFGCKLNSYETEGIKNLCDSVGLLNTTVINSCAVTAEAVRKTKRHIRKSKKETPNNKIIVTGCAAQIDPKMFSEMKEVDSVIGNSEKRSKSIWKKIAKNSQKPFDKRYVKVEDIFKLKSEKLSSLPVNGIGSRSRAYVQIQNGCDHRCTFCIIPFARGNSRSIEAKDIIKQIETLVIEGFREVTLTGVDITSWGRDLPGSPKLGFLVKEILASTPNLLRLRLSSIDQVEVDEDLINIMMTSSRLMPHLHLSFQSGDNLILKRMKRRHCREDIVKFCDRLRSRRPEFVFGADIIVGFPTETDEMFKNTFELVSRCQITWLHVFPFSARNGTPAARMPKVNEKSIRMRAKTLRELGSSMIKSYLSDQIGKTQPVLMESTHKGRTEGFAEVTTAVEMPVGEIVNLRISGSNGSQLIGTPA
ncbi:MAG: tRNA (N(6)-L-threonylcarbamoyladenosine(37)-C(2))-methylthiotransferase MtaB [Pseudomonadota bacterium]|nr:tRNA (N(6)-L-threonylcarbamoyladenosine(37)-C(2))-methylthiotransferase MtaB [Pseudomonadota bacterium]